MKKIFPVILLIILLCVSEAYSLSVPEKYYLRDENRIAVPQEQIKLETCWAFAAIGACGSNYMTQNFTASFDLDVNELLDSDFSFKGKGDAFTAAALLSGRTGAVRLHDAFLLSKNHVFDPQNDRSS